MGLLDNEQRIYQNLLDFGQGDPNFRYSNILPIRYPVNAPKPQSFTEFRQNAELATPNFLRALPAQLFKSFTLPAQAVRGKMVTPQEATDFALTYGGTALTGASLGGVPKGAIGTFTGKNPLIVQHNINEIPLRKSVELGGLPVPSLAISKVDSPLVGFGDISLLGSPKLAIPKGSNPVYRSDAYTVRRPYIEGVSNEKADRFVNKNFEDVQSKLGYLESSEDIAKGIFQLGSDYDSQALRAKYLVDKGEIKLSDYPTDNISGKQDFRDIVREKYIDQEDYSNYITQLRQNVIDAGGDVKERIFMGYTDNGRKYIPATLENITKVMKKQRGAGEENFFNQSLGAVRAKVTPKFKNITEIKKNRDKIDEVQFKKRKDELNDAFFKFNSKVADRLPSDTPRETVNELTNDLIYGGFGNDNFSRQYTKYMNDDILRDGESLRKELINMPTEYFEIKPQRAVNLDEFKGAVVPEKTMDSTINMLNQSGIDKIYKYSNNENNARSELFKKFPELMFGVGSLGLLDMMVEND